MRELEHLRSMWAEKVKRKTDLIVSQVTYGSAQKGSLNNDSWTFIVPYAFREALDIKYEERRLGKKPYAIWTQGPFLNFKEGDMIHAKDGSRAVQVRFANRMGWNPAKGEMDEGNVIYSVYTMNDSTLALSSEHTCTQMQFLQMLIHGENNIEQGNSPSQE